jgi:hypothetical protein
MRRGWGCENGTYIETEKEMKPSATHAWLLASVMAVLWAIITTIFWALLAVGFGRSRGDLRLMTMLIDHLCSGGRIRVCPRLPRGVEE